MKKLAGILLCLLMVFECTSMSNIIVFAQSIETTEEYPVHYYDRVLGENSENGLIDEKWVDENGNEVELDNSGSSKSFRTRAALPSSYNSADLGYITSTKNQGQAGSCWAFACVSTAEANLLRKHPSLSKDTLDLSEAHHVWYTFRSLSSNTGDTTYGDGLNEASPYNNGGYWWYSMFSLSRGSGFALDSDYPFYPSDLRTMENKMESLDESARYDSKYRITDSSLLPDSDKQAIKEAIMNKGAVAASFYHSSDFESKSNGKLSYYYPGESSSSSSKGKNTNHMFCVVGWDDNYSAGNFTVSTPPGNGAWICKNSWGDYWGNNGFFYLSYYDKSISKYHTVEADYSGKYQTTYQYDGFGYSRQVFSSGVGTVSFANIFTAQKDENIHSVGFYTYNDSLNYTVDVYTSIDQSGSSPATNGTLALSQSGTLDYQGYHTVKLRNDIKAKMGEKFSVVITLSGNSTTYLPVEGYNSRYNGYYTEYHSSSPNQSYYKIGSNSWVDSNKAGCNNVCVKAFTFSAETLEISTADQLRSFADAVNSGKSFYGATITLTNDIDMSESYNNDNYFTPIGTEERRFDGNFNGNGKVIKNLCMIKPSLDNVGLFGYTGEKSTVTSVGLENAYIKGKNNVGGLIGKSFSKSVNNCYVAGTVIGTENVGGLIGYNASTETKNSFSNANVKGKTTCGSFAGYDGSSYRNCYALNTLPTVGNADSVTGIAAKTSNDFKSGNVASSFKGVYFLYIKSFGGYGILSTDGYTHPEYMNSESYNGSICVISPVDGFFWTQGKNHPVHSTQQGDIIQSCEVTLVRDDVDENETITLYAPRNKTAKSVLEEKYPDYNCALYLSDDFTQEEFTDTLTYEGRTFVAKLDRKPNSGNDPVIDEPSDEPEYYPYVDEIDNVEDFILFVDSVNHSRTYEGMTVNLNVDLDLTGVNIAPIGNDEYPFNGTFNGNGKVISNLTISSPSSDNVGLFGITGTKCTIKNLGLENVNVMGNDNVGGLVGKSMSKEISNCYVAGSIKGNSNVGGLVGYNSSTTTKTCFSVATVTAPASYGSIAGYSESVYSNCYALDTIRPVAGADEISGIAGKSSEEFRNGNVAYLLTNPTGMYWTKGEDHPVLSANSKDEVHNLKLYVNKTDTGEWDRITVYVAESENPKNAVAPLYEDYNCTVYNDSGFVQEFTGSVKNDTTTLAAKLVNKNSSGENPGNDDPGDDYPEIYQISTPEDLVELAKSVNNHSKSYYGKTVTLTADIDMTGIVFTPIGSGGTPFDGTFNGDGKVIRNLTVSSSDDNVGLFAMTGPSSTIKALGLESVNIRGKDNVGGMVGFSMSKSIYNCHVEGNVTGENNVGGLIGKALGDQVINDYSITNVEGTQNVGGFIGCDESNTTTYSYTLSNVTAQTMYGSFVGYAGSSYYCCYTSGSTNTTGSNYQNSGISTKSIEDFKNGNVAFSLKSYTTLYGVIIYVGFNGYHWAQGENYPVLSSDLNDCMHNLTLKVVKDDSPTTEQITIYLSGNDDPLKKVYDLYNGYYCTLYNDSDFTKDPFLGAITSDGKTLYAKLEKAEITLADGSPYRMYDDVIFGIEQGTTLSMLKEQLNQKDIVRCRDSFGSPVMQSSPIATGNLLFITNSQGRIIKDVKVSVSGDVTGDGFIDAFDLAVAGEYINTFTEPEDEAFMKACDMFEDGYLDATDLAYLMYIANFE